MMMMTRPMLVISMIMPMLFDHQSLYVDCSAGTSILWTLSLVWWQAWMERSRDSLSMETLGLTLPPGENLILPSSPSQWAWSSPSSSSQCPRLWLHIIFHRADDAMAMGTYQGPPCQNNPCRYEKWYEIKSNQKMITSNITAVKDFFMLQGYNRKSCIWHRGIIERKSRI